MCELYCCSGRKSNFSLAGRCFTIRGDFCRRAVSLSSPLNLVTVALTDNTMVSGDLAIRGRDLKLNPMCLKLQVYVIFHSTFIPITQTNHLQIAYLMSEMLCFFLTTLSLIWLPVKGCACNEITAVKVWMNETEKQTGTDSRAISPTVWLTI